MRTRTMSLGSPYNPLAFHLLTRALFSPEELEEVKQKRESGAPCGVYYSADIASKSYVINHRGGVPDMIVSQDKFEIPLIQIACNPVIKKSEVEHLTETFGRIENAVNHSIARAEDSLRRQIDMEVFKILNVACTNDHTIGVSGRIEPGNLNHGLSLLDEHELPRGAIVMHPSRYLDLMNWENTSSLKETSYSASTVKVGEPPIWAYYKNVPIYVSSTVFKNVVFLLAKKEHVGVIPVAQDIDCKPAEYVLKDPKSEKRPSSLHIFQRESLDEINKIKELQYGSWVVSAELGFGVVHDFTIAKIKVS